MLLTHKTSIPIYNQSVLFIIGDPIETQDYLSDVHRKDFSFNSDETDAIAFHCGLDHIIWLSSEISFPELTHELGHATFDIMLDIGLDLHDQEAFCYLQQFLVEECGKIFEISMKPIKQV